MASDMKRMLEASIATAEEKIMHCREELEGKREISNLHRNMFHHIAQKNQNIAYFFDEKDIEYRRLTDAAKVIIEERSKEYDRICRIYLDVEKMKDVFRHEAESDVTDVVSSSNLSDLVEGKLITGAQVMDYAWILQSKGSSEGFEAAVRINEAELGSDSRIDSVKREIEVFEGYIKLCRKRLDAL